MTLSLDLTRRTFLHNAALLTVAASASTLTPSQAPDMFVQTVLGPVPASKLGVTLVHEHVMCDFIGAEQTNRNRWEVETVVKRMLPVLRQLKERGVTGFIDCTPAYIGRDPRVLKQLAQETGLHIVTNTGYYGGADDKFVPKYAYGATPDQLADLWVAEFVGGIEGTGVKPGFMKIGIDEIKGSSDRLSPIDEKLVRASARASRRSDLSVTCHTGGGPAGLAATKIFIEERADPGRFIVAHSDGHGLPINRAVAAMGAWVSFDGIGRQPIESHLKLVHAMTERHANRLLLSQDSGWYWVGQQNGGEIRNFNYMSDVFLPALRSSGISEATIRRLTVENPANAFAIRFRR
jgi:predicted metal-dependent phosphotriesterase family hydrolase